MFANNIFWTDATHGYGFFLDAAASSVSSHLTNMYASGAISITTPIVGNSTGGWGGFTSAVTYSGVEPLNTHITGLTSGNFLSTTQAPPYNRASYVPIPGSDLIGAGSANTALPYPMNLLPRMVRS